MIKKLIILFAVLLSTSVRAEIIELLVPFNVGASTDSIARQISKTQPKFIVINKIGGNGSLAMNDLAEKKSIALVIDTTIFGSNLITFKDKLTYNPANYDVLAVVGSSPNILLCRAGLNFKNLKDLSDYKGSLNFAVAQRGGIEHIRTEILIKKINRNDQIIFYPGGASRAAVDLLGGHVDCYFALLSNVIQMVNSDRLTKLLITGHTNLISSTVETWQFRFREPMSVTGYYVIVAHKSQFTEQQKSQLIKNLEREITTHQFTQVLKDLAIEPEISFGSVAQKHVNTNVTNTLDAIRQLKIRVSDD